MSPSALLLSSSILESIWEAIKGNWNIAKTINQKIVHNWKRVPFIPFAAPLLYQEGDQLLQQKKRHILPIHSSEHFLSRPIYLHYSKGAAQVLSVLVPSFCNFLLERLLIATSPVSQPASQLASHWVPTNYSSCFCPFSLTLFFIKSSAPLGSV